MGAAPAGSEAKIKIKKDKAQEPGLHRGKKGWVVWQLQNVNGGIFTIRRSMRRAHIVTVEETSSISAAGERLSERRKLSAATAGAMKWERPLRRRVIAEKPRR